MLNQAFFSARLLASRVEAPFQVFSSSRLVRGVAARDLMSFLGFGMTMLSMAKLGAEAFEKATGKEAPFSIELDPRSTDFGKAKVGPTRIDFWGGFQPLARYAAQIATQQRKSASGDLLDVSVTDSIGRFLRSKLSPQAGFAADVLTGETFLGEEVSPTTEGIKTQAFNRLVPLFAQDIVDSIREGDTLSPFLTLPGAFGASVQTYRTPSEETAAKIAEDLERGQLTGGYTRQPTRLSELTQEDREGFDQRHPEVVEAIRKQQEKGFEEQTERGEFSRQSQIANQNLDQELESISITAQSGGFGDLSEQDARTAVWDKVRDQEKLRAGAIINLQQSFPDVLARFREGEPASREQELVNRYFELRGRHSYDTDEQWAAYEADLQRTFSPDDLDTVQRELAVGNHDLQNQWDFLNAQLEGYYDVPEGPRQAQQRIILRRRNPQLDAALWILGRVGRVLTAQATQLAEQGAQTIFGQRVQASRGTSGGSGIGRSIGTSIGRSLGR